jgi:5-methylcytosine-specific restriction enzyme subunit McrC
VSRLVELFEHETIRVGRPMRGVDGRDVELTERHFEDLVRFNDANGQRFFDIGHRSIKLTQYVGYIEVGDLAIQILPKADRDQNGVRTTKPWADALLAMLAVATGVKLESPHAASQKTKRSMVLELVVARFLDEVEVLLHHGLAKGYRNEELNGATFRGRLLVNEHVRINIARADRFYASAQTYDRDVLVNRILRAALDETSMLALSPALAGRSAMFRGSFPEVGAFRATPDTFERLRLTRSTSRYANALTLARMLLEHASPQLRAGGSRVFALLFDMNVLWERYVAALFRRAAGPELSASCQERHLFWQSDAHKRGVRPDIVVRERATSKVVLIADTKWKIVTDGPPADADLQQMFVYNELLDGGLAMLVYPGVSRSGATAGAYHRKTHRCETLHMAVVGPEGWRGTSLVSELAALASNRRAPQTHRLDCAD